jgi:BirA family biotin operon repressor/biotin-[acetyl-CoA-carboxylase] ligase
MERGYKLQILLLDVVDSTQTWLKKALQENKLIPPIAVYAKIQTSGKGSRGNSWIGEEGNLFLSFALYKDTLPNDLKIESASIYFAYLLKEVLQEAGSKVWIKWPNDFYMYDKKVGGMITTVVKDCLICGVGINIKKAPQGFATLDIEIETQEVVEKFVKKMEKFVSWKQVFRKYSVEFYKNKPFCTHTIENNKVKMEDAILNEDGSITIEGERIYSLR